MLESILKFLVVFFVVVEPLSLVPAFASLTQNFTPDQRRHIATKAATISAMICLIFAIAGAKLLQVLGISLDAFRIGAGILLFLIALDMVFARASPVRGTTAGEADEVKHRHDISVFPLAFPLMTGPGAMATIMLAFGESHLSWIVFFGQMLAMLIVLLAAWITMRLTTPMMRIMGVTGANVISRLFGVILAALAVQYIIDGIKGAMH